MTTFALLLGDPEKLRSEIRTWLVQKLESSGNLIGACLCDAFDAFQQNDLHRTHLRLVEALKKQVENGSADPSLLGIIIMVDILSAHTKS